MTEKWKVVVIVLFATLAVAIGEALLSKGVKLASGSGGSAAAIRSVLNGHVLCGTLLMMLYFGLYMYALRLADFSFVLPLTALSFLFGAVIARYYLHENVTSTRWLGTLVIIAGVVIVGLGEAGKQ